MIWYILKSESVSVYGRHVVGLLSVWFRDCRSAVGYDSSIVWSVFNRCHVGYLSVSNRAIPYRILPEMTPTWTRLVLRCLQQQCWWPTAGRFIENFAVFVGFVSVWPVWLGYNYAHQTRGVYSPFTALPSKISKLSILGKTISARHRLSHGYVHYIQ